MKKQDFDDVPKDGVGAFVQNWIDAGAKKVTVVPNADGTTCTVTVEE
jgi:hypothetical protein